MIKTALSFTPTQQGCNNRMRISIMWGQPGFCKSDLCISRLRDLTPTLTRCKLCADQVVREPAAASPSLPTTARLLSDSPPGPADLVLTTPQNSWSPLLLCPLLPFPLLLFPPDKLAHLSGPRQIHVLAPLTAMHSSVFCSHLLLNCTCLRSSHSGLEFAAYTSRAPGDRPV